MYKLGRAVSSTVNTCGRKSAVISRRAYSSFTRDPKKSNKALFLLLGGSAVLLGLAAKPSLAQAEESKSAPQPKEVPKAVVEALKEPRTKPRLVVLGSGWAALEIIKNVDRNLYEVVVISPRNYFLFTPLLASAAVGTIEFQSVIEPFRKLCKNSKDEIKYFEAACTDVFYDKNVVRCQSATGVQSKVEIFDIEYDTLVVAVGSQASHMGKKGVQQNALFLKDIHDARKIRARIIECFETANLPAQTAEEQQRLLHFVIVGGGPTGVEFSAELHDFVREDVPKYYPQLAQKIKITLIQSGEHILNAYDLKISLYAEQKFKRDKIDVITNARVNEVTPTSITIFNQQNNKNEELNCGMTVWATGISPVPLTVKLAESIPEQTNKRALTSDEYLLVKGIPNKNVYAVGDCLTVTQRKMTDQLVNIFNEADTDKNGALDISELSALFKKIVKDYPHLQPFTRGIELLVKKFDENNDGVLQLDEFKKLVHEVDSKLKSIPTTAQAASQAGKYLADSLNAKGRDKTAQIAPFAFKPLGIMAYVGGDSAVLDTSNYKGGGFGVWLLWSAAYLFKLSWRNKFSLLFDWTKTFVNGRDISII